MVAPMLHKTSAILWPPHVPWPRHHVSWPRHDLRWLHHGDGEHRKRRWYRNGHVIAATVFSVVVVIAVVVMVALANSAPRPSTVTVTPTPPATDAQAWDLNTYLNALITPNAPDNATYYPPGSSFTDLFDELYPGTGTAPGT
jgi:hypothetical protein